MWRSHIRIALRRLLKYRTVSLINIAGLAMGLAACILIVLYVANEWSYDRYHERADRIFRMSRQWFDDSGRSTLHLGHVAPPFAVLLKNDFPDLIEQSVRLFKDRSLLVCGDKKFYEEKIFYADPGILKVFSWRLLRGRAEDLEQPNMMLLTAETARRYFGDEDPVGRVIRNEEDKIDLKVAGVIEDIPANSHFQFDMLISLATIESLFGREKMMTNFGSNNYATYLLLVPGRTAQELDARLPAFIDRHLSNHHLPPGVKPSQVNRLHLWPLTDIHLYSRLDSEIEPNGDVRLIYVYVAIAGFILLIACINFMNLSTARASERFREVGLRKVVGADRRMLVGQFLGESLVIAMIATISAVGLVEMALPWFNEFVGKSLEFDLTNPKWIGAGLLLTAIFVGVVSGSYPAFYLSGFSPASVLKGSFTAGRRESFFRSLLVVAQFAISISLMGGLGMIHLQLEYFRTKDLGFDQ